MIDQVYAELPPVSGPDARTELTTLAHAYRAVLLRHPWLAQQAAGRPALGPHVIGWLDAALALVHRRTDDATRASMIIDALITWVTGSAASELAEAAAQQRSGVSEQEWRRSVGAYIRRVVDSGRYPDFNRRVLEADDVDAATQFEYGLDRLLTGLLDATTVESPACR